MCRVCVCQEERRERNLFLAKSLVSRGDGGPSYEGEAARTVMPRTRGVPASESAPGEPMGCDKMGSGAGPGGQADRERKLAESNVN
jgi:hypothetical protein